MAGLHKQSVHGALFCAALLGAVALMLSAFAERGIAISPEVHFTDASKDGMQILPASCSSDPSYFHGDLTASGDGLGHISATGQSEYGVTKNSISLCVTNSTGSSYFVPTNTAAEMNAVKAVGSSITNLQVW